MVTTSRSQELYRFTVDYVEAVGLRRILEALFRERAEPAWVFSRVQSKKCFRIDIDVADLPDAKAAGQLAARLRAMPSVQSVKFKASTPNPTIVKIVKKPAM